MVEKKNKKNVKGQNFDGEANWLGVVSFYCMQMSMQMSLVMSMWFIFRKDWNDVPDVHHFFALWQ